MRGEQRENRRGKDFRLGKNVRIPGKRGPTGDSGRRTFIGFAVIGNHSSHLLQPFHPAQFLFSNATGKKGRKKKQGTKNEKSPSSVAFSFLPLSVLSCVCMRACVEIIIGGTRHERGHGNDAPSKTFQIVSLSLFLSLSLPPALFLSFFFLSFLSKLLLDTHRPAFMVTRMQSVG